jgi:hypothetical protein
VGLRVVEEGAKKNVKPVFSSGKKRRVDAPFDSYCSTASASPHCSTHAFPRPTTKSTRCSTTASVQSRRKKGESASQACVESLEGLEGLLEGEKEALREER